jgi:hypothetical protein
MRYVGTRARLTLVAVVAATFVAAPAARAYSWPTKPFHKAHTIRAGFGDPRFHVGETSEISAFHFGVDVVARDGTPVYSVEPGWVIRRHNSSVTIGRANGRRFGYWHIRPIVRSGHYVRLHQLIGHVIKGWGHVHFAESMHGRYRDPLRKGALTPFFDHTAPTVGPVQLVDLQGAQVDPAQVSGLVSVVAEASDTPPILPPSPWDVARLVPATVRWKLTDAAGTNWGSVTTVSFLAGLPDSDLYDFVYAPGTYQNKPHRPGHYLFWVIPYLDTTIYPNATYRLEVDAIDTRGNVGSATLDFTIANG